MPKKLPFAQLSFSQNSWCLTAATFSLATAGFMLTSPTDAAAQSWSEKLDGVEYATVDRVHAVRIDLDLVGVSIFPKVSAKSEPATPKSWAQKHSLEVAINANFYGMSDYSPCSFAICEGVNWGSSWNTATYAQMGFTKDNRLKWLTQSSEAGQQNWMYHVVSGTPEIVVNGAVVPNLHSSQACKDLGHCANTRARSGMGVDKDQKYLYLVVSKGDGSSSGNTVSDFATSMVKLGVWYGINLDGGGSSGLYVNGTTYGTNVSSRSVSVNLGFNVQAKPEYVCKATEIDNPSSIFYDIPAGHWGLDAAKALADRNVTLGCGNSAYGNPLFCPDCGTKRIQGAIFLARALKLNDTPPSTPSFTDVTVASVGSEGYAAVEALLKKGIISKAEYFRPNDILMRSETATMISKAYIGDTTLYKNAPTPTFSDVDPTHWSYQFVEAMARHCYMSGTGSNQFSPNAPTSRIEFAVALARAAQWINNSCAFTKECDTNGEKSCSGKNIMVCTAYELVQNGTCPSGTTCQNGTCITNAACNASDAKTCDGASVKSCVNGQWSTSPCAYACENGKCVECTSNNTAPICQGNTIAKCVNGQYEYSSCGSNENCINAKCETIQTCNAGERQCRNNQIYVCNGTTWSLEENCELNAQICENGTCITPQTECTSNDAPTCASDNSIKLCSEGKFVIMDCNDDEKCTNGVCVLNNAGNNDNEHDDTGNNNDNGNSDDTGNNDNGNNNDNDNTGNNDNGNNDNGNNDNGDSSDSDDDSEGEIVYFESSCSQGRHSGHPTLWLLAILGCLSGLVLRRTKKYHV